MRRDVAGIVTFESVSFRYPETETPVLSEISFETPPGSTVAIVGRSGAGKKTTLCNLVARFFRSNIGVVIRLDGVDLRDIELHSYRKLLGVVEQDVFLFDGTIRENILMVAGGRLWKRLSLQRGRLQHMSLLSNHRRVIRHGLANEDSSSVVGNDKG